MASQRHVNVGGVQVGGGAPVVVQTMTKTETANLTATMDQIRRVADAGADLVRVAVPRDQDVEALKTIVRRASTSRSRGTATRTTSAPASATRRIWSIVAVRFAVSVFVMVCTTTGAPPPIRTPPTVTCRWDAIAYEDRSAAMRSSRCDHAGSLTVPAASPRARARVHATVRSTSSPAARA